MTDLADKIQKRLWGACNCRVHREQLIVDVLRMVADDQAIRTTYGEDMPDRRPFTMDLIGVDDLRTLANELSSSKEGGGG